MFRTDEHFKVNMPSALFGEDPAIVYYHLFEQTLHCPVWVAKVLGEPDDESLQRWQTFFIGGPVSEALKILGMDQWQHRNLYVILPEHMTGKDRMTMALCSAVWKCEEPDSEQPCWVYETDTGSVIESHLGSSIEEVIKRELVWASPSIDVPHR